MVNTMPPRIRQIEPCVHVPIDFESRQQFRLLAQQIGVLEAAGVLVFLWRELAYTADRADLGLLSKDDLALFNHTICNQTEGELPNATEHLIKAGVLRPRPIPENGPGQNGERPTDYDCPMFNKDNEHLGVMLGNVSMGQPGGFATSIKYRKRKVEAETSTQLALIDADKFEKPDGARMDPDECNRCVMMVKMFDNFTGRRSRLSSEFTVGLMQDAWRIISNGKPEAIDQMCHWLMANQDNRHPGLPKTTEQVLRDFDRYYVMMMTGVDRGAPKAPAATV